LTTDIINVHYPDYYDDPKNNWPSDDQNPNPVYFLVMRPDVQFLFAYKLDLKLASTKSDEPAKDRKRVLTGFTQEILEAKIEEWLKKGLSLCGIGAKTAKGYGHFGSRNIPIPEASAKTGKIVNAGEVTEEEPPSIIGKVKPFQNRCSGITKNYNQMLWQTILEKTPHIEKVSAIGQRGEANQIFEPTFQWINQNKLNIKIKYSDLKFVCEVEINFTGISKIENVYWLWHNNILPELKKLLQNSKP
jgi:hypothetical protein